jgi:hypothetical protein
MKPFRFALVFGWKIPILKMNPQEDVVGVYIPEAKTIGVASGARGEDLEKVCMHEILHAMMDRLYIDSQVDEKLVEVIIENSCQVIFENFKVKWRK